jgi:hypothetical protein
MDFFMSGFTVEPTADIRHVEYGCDLQLNSGAVIDACGIVRYFIFLRTTAHMIMAMILLNSAEGLAQQRNAAFYRLIRLAKPQLRVRQHVLTAVSQINAAFVPQSCHALVAMGCLFLVQSSINAMSAMELTLARMATTDLKRYVHLNRFPSSCAILTVDPQLIDLTQITIVWGITGVNRSKVNMNDFIAAEMDGLAIYNGSIDFSTPEAQQSLLDACIEITESELVYKGITKCFIRPFKVWALQKGYGFPVRDQPLRRIAEFLLANRGYALDGTK